MYMVLQFMLKKDFLLHGTYFRKLCRFFYETLQIVAYFFGWLYFTHWPTSFSSIDHGCLYTVFYFTLSNIDEVLSINPSANVFCSGEFNTHHKDWLTYSAGTDRPGELCYHFSISNKRTQMVYIPFHIPTVTLTILIVWISFFLLMIVFVLQWLSFYWEILVILLSQFHWLSLKLKTGCFVSLHSLWPFSCWLGWSSW